MSLPRSLPRPALKPQGRLLVLLICVASASFHLFLAHGCASVQATLGRQIEDDDEGGEWRKLEAIKLVVGVARLSSLVGVAMAVAGFVGIVRDKPTPVRLFMLNSFLSLGSELLLLALVSLLTFSSMSSSSFSSSLCEAIAHSDMGSIDVLGWSLESCEERWKGLATGMSGFITTIALIRAWASLHILSYYTTLYKRSRRQQQSLTINTNFHRTNEHFSDAGVSRDLASPSSGSKGRAPHRIFLLPNPVDTTTPNGDLPMLSFTPSSPLDSFPPKPLPIPSPPTDAMEEQKFLVYAPVMMTAEQARQMNAREVTYSRPRTRSNASINSFSSPVLTSALTEMPSPISPEEDTPLALASMVKGKLA